MAEPKLAAYERVNSLFKKVAYSPQDRSKRPLLYATAYTAYRRTPMLPHRAQSLLTCGVKP